MNIMGIDPGKKGGIAVIGPLNEVLYLSKMPAIHLEILELFMTLRDEYKVEMIFIEETQYRPNQRGVITTLTNYGRLLGYIEALGIKCTKIHPTTWKKKFGLTKDKADSINMANREFNQSLSISRDGEAEALLIALYGRTYNQ